MVSMMDIHLPGTVIQQHHNFNNQDIFWRNNLIALWQIVTTLIFFAESSLDNSG